MKSRPYFFRCTFLILMTAGVYLGGTPAHATKTTKAYREAKKKCLKEDPMLRGKALQKCIAKKMK
jgi:hypothetical protein